MFRRARPFASAVALALTVLGTACGVGEERDGSANAQMPDDALGKSQQALTSAATTW